MRKKGNTLIVSKSIANVRRQFLLTDNKREKLRIGLKVVEARQCCVLNSYGKERRQQGKEDNKAKTNSCPKGFVAIKSYEEG